MDEDLEMMLQDEMDAFGETDGGPQPESEEHRPAAPSAVSGVPHGRGGLRRPAAAEATEADEDEELLGLMGAHTPAEPTSRPPHLDAEEALELEEMAAAGAGGSSLPEGLDAEEAEEMRLLGAASQGRRGRSILDAEELEELDMEAAQEEDPSSLLLSPSSSAFQSRRGHRHQHQQHPLLAPRVFVPPSRSVFDLEDLGGESSSVMVTSREAGGDAVFCAVRPGRPGLSQGQAKEVMAALQLEKEQEEASRGGGGPSSSMSSASRFAQMMEEVEAEQLRRAVRDSDVPGAGNGRNNDGFDDDDEEEEEEDLWVDKYAPGGYMDLLSQEQLNREVLTWIKAWDKTVFGDKRQQQQQTGRGAAAAAGGGGGGGALGQRGHQQQQQQGRRPGGSFRGFGEDGIKEDTRPTPRVLLLTGPPGAGKTTLVHVLAKHCGYRAFEINASDDRTGAAVGQRVRDAVTMQAVLGERKPNLVVVDEIDGAAGGSEGRSAVSALLRIVNDEGLGGGGGGGGSRGGGGKAAFSLSRPIICICNDPFVPALKPLREVAQVMHVKPPSSERLLPRVQAVCSAEGLRATRAALAALAERSGNDIRSCLNALQLLAGRKRQQRGAAAGGGAKGGGRKPLGAGGSAIITPRDVEAMQMASKDVERSAFRVWEEVFFVPQRPALAAAGLKAAESPVDRLNRRMQVLVQFGDPELLLNGCHENMFGGSVHYNETGFSKTTALSEWMSDSDTVLKAMHRRSEFSLMAYLPTYALAVSHLASSPSGGRPRLQWPRALSSCSQRANSNRSLAASWCASASPAVQSGTGVRASILEVLPSLLLALNPRIKAQAPHLMSPADKDAVSDLAGRLLAYGLTFRVGHGHSYSSHPSYGSSSSSIPARGHLPPLPPLQPPVDAIAAFPIQAATAGPTSKRPAPMAEEMVRQVAREVTLEAIRRASARSCERAGTAEAPAVEDVGSSSQAPAPAPAPRPIAQPLQLTLSDRIRASSSAAPPPSAASAGGKRSGGSWLDAFRKSSMQTKTKRCKTASCGDPQGEGGADVAPKAAQGKHGPVLYRFHEGYTNAVKRPLRMADLLGAS